MADDLAVLLVGTDEPKTELTGILRKEGIVGERASAAQLPDLLASKNPALVVHMGAQGASETVRALQEFEKEGRRVRVVIIADRPSLPLLRKLDRAIVGSLLATDMPDGVVAARITMLARKGGPRTTAAAASRKGPASPEPASIQPSLRQGSGATASEDSGLLAISNLPPSGELGLRLSRSAPAPTASLPPRPAKASRKAPEPAPPPARTAAEPSSKEPTTAPLADAPTTPTTTEISAEELRQESLVERAPRPPGMPPSSASLPLGELRVLVADSDMTRGDSIAQGLRDAGVRALLVPLDPALTRWDLARRFRPTLLVVDGSALESTGQVWFQLFQADRAFSQTRLASVVFERMFDDDTGAADLRMLIPQVPQLASQGRPPPPREVMEEDVEFSSEAHNRATLTEEDLAELERVTSVTGGASDTAGQTAPADSAEAGTRGRPSEAVEHVEEVEVDELPSDIILPSLEEIAPDSDESERSAPGNQEPSLEDAGSPPAPSAGSAPAPSAVFASEGVPPSRATPPPLEHRVSKEAERSAALVGRWAWAAVALIALGGAGVYLALETELLSGLPFLARAPSDSVREPTPAASSIAIAKASQASSPQARAEAQGTEGAPGEKAAEEETKEPAFDPWVMPPAREVPSCEELIENPEEIRRSGVDHAARAWSGAKKSLVLGNLDEAHQQLCEAVLAHPESYALEGLVEVLLSFHAADRAQQWMDTARQVRPGRRKTQELVGDVLSQLGQVENARATWAASIEVEVDDERTLRLVGDQYVTDAERARTSGDRARAERLYRRAVTLSPRNPEALTGLASTFLAWNDAADPSSSTLPWAEHWAQEALRLDQGHANALVVLADVAQLRGDESAALLLYKKALETAPSHSRAHQQIYRLEN